MKLARFQESSAFPRHARLIPTAERSETRKVVVSNVNKKNEKFNRKTAFVKNKVHFFFSSAE